MQRLGLDVSTITLEDPKRGEQEMQGTDEKQSVHVHLQAPHGTSDEAATDLFSETHC